MTRFHLWYGEWWWFVMGFYLARDDASTIYITVLAIVQCL